MRNKTTPTLTLEERIDKLEDDYMAHMALSEEWSEKAVSIINDLQSALKQRNDVLRGSLEALKAISNMYGNTWDLVDGGLMMMADSGVPKFEKAHAKVVKAIESIENALKE